MEPLRQQLMIVACLRSVQIFLALNLTGISWDDLNIELAIIYWLRLGLQPLTKKVNEAPVDVDVDVVVVVVVRQQWTLCTFLMTACGVIKMRQ